MTRAAAFKLAGELADAGFSCQVTIQATRPVVADVRARYVPEFASVALRRAGRYTLDELAELHAIGARYGLGAQAEADIAYVEPRL